VGITRLASLSSLMIFLISIWLGWSHDNAAFGVSTSTASNRVGKMGKSVC